MFSLIKKLFKNNVIHDLDQFFQHAGQKKPLWVSIAINKRSIANSILTKELDLLTEKDVFSLKIADSKNGLFHQLWKNHEPISEFTIAQNSPDQTKMTSHFNHLIDKHIDSEIKFFQKELNNINNDIIFTKEEIALEEKALEWMKASFKVLEKAVIESLTNPDLLFQTLLFFGINPKTQKHEVRIILFNLDIIFELHENTSIRIKIFNDKNNKFGSNKKADLEGDFKLRKREMLDELTKIISVISPGIKS